MAVLSASGISLVIFGIRTLLEMHPDWVVVLVDIRNAFNEIKRAQILQRLDDCPQLRALLPLFHATHSVCSPVYLAASGLQRADFNSEKGACFSHVFAQFL